MVLTYVIYTFLFAFTMSFAYLGIKENGQYDSVIKKSIWLYWGIAIALYTLIVGLRENVGIDYFAYKRIFFELMAFSQEVRQKDIIFYLFFPIVKNFHYNIFISFLAFLTIFFLFKSFEDRIKILPYYLFFYFTLLTFFTSLNVMRQHAVFFILLFSINQFYKKKYSYFIVSYVLATIIHFSALFVLPFIFLFRKDLIKSRLLQYGLLFSTFWGGYTLFNYIIEPLMSVLSQLNIGDQYAGYMQNPEFWIQRVVDRRNDASGTGLFRYLLLSIDCVVIFYSAKLKEEYPQYNFVLFYNFFIVGAIVTNITNFHEAANRLISYFEFYRIYIYAIFFYYLFSDRTNKELYMLRSFLSASFFSICLIFFYLTIHRGPMRISPFNFLKL